MLGVVREKQKTSVACIPSVSNAYLLAQFPAHRFRCAACGSPFLVHFSLCPFPPLLSGNEVILHAYARCIDGLLVKVVNDLLMVSQLRCARCIDGLQLHIN